MSSTKFIARNGLAVGTSATDVLDSSGTLLVNAPTATKLLTARTISLSGDVAGSVSFDGSGNADITATIQANSVALGTDTTGNYVATIDVSGTGLSVSGSGSENAGVTITSNATNLNTASTIVARDVSGNFSAGTITAALSGNATTASTLQTARTISLSGDVAGSVSFDGSGNADISTTIQPNSIALGTDTTGNYMVNVAAGTGVSVSHTQGEGSTATVSIGQAVGTTDNVTFNNVTVNGTLSSDDITSTNISVAGNATITGNLTVSGTTTTVNSTTIALADANLELARNATTAAQANGAGITVTGPATPATITYTSADDRWNLNKNLNVTTVYGALSGNASTASAWQTARTLSYTGDATGSMSVDGSTNVSTALTLAASGVTAGTYNNVTVNTKGIVTSGSNVAYLTSYTESDTLATVTGRGASTSTASTFSGGLYSRKSQTAGNYTTAALWTESYDNTATGIAFHISGVVGKYLEMRTNGTLYWNGDTVWHSGNLTNLNQLSNGPGYITGESDTLASVTSRGASTSTNITLTGGSLTLSGSAANLYMVGDNSYRWISGTSGYGVGSGFGLYSDTLGAYYMSLSTSGNWYLGVNNHNSSYRLSVNGTAYATDDIRSPIFYDANDTTYYLDPNTTGTSLYVAGNIRQGNGGSDTGLAIYHGNGSGDYGRIRFYQAGSNNQTIHVFPTTWQGGTLASTSTGAINLTGANGVTFGDWNNVDGYFGKSGNLWVRTKIGIGVDASAKLHIQVAAPSGAQAVNGAASVVIDNTGNNFIQFRNSADNGTYQGLLFSDNNQGGYVAFGNAGAGDLLRLGGYNYISFDVGTDDSTSSVAIKTQRGYIDTSANMFAFGSMRSPIFYDYNDTGYYLDPNNTSVLNKLFVRGKEVVGEHESIKTWSSGYFTANGGSAQRYTIGRIYFTPNHWGDWSVIKVTLQEHSYSQSEFQYNIWGWYGMGNGSSMNIDCVESNGWANSKARVILGTPTLAGWQYAGQDTYYQDVYVDCDSYTNQDVIVKVSKSTISTSNPGSGTGWAYVFYDSPSITSISTFSDSKFFKDRYYRENTSSFRAPTFYDLDDTSYYLDLNSTSNSALRIRGGALHGPNPTWGKYLYIGTDGNPGTGNSSVTVTNGNLHIDAENGYVLYLNNYSSSSYTVASQSMRSPIFYDNNDTGYYLDPNSSSFLYYTSVNVGQEATGGANSSSAGLVLRGNYNSNTWAHKFHKYDNGSGVPLYLSTTYGTGSWTAMQGWGGGLPYTSQVYGSFGASSVYSQIFYDSDNTGYYADPNNTSRFAKIVQDQRYDACNLATYGGLYSGDWQSLTNTEGQFNYVQVNNIASGHSNYPSSVYTYGGVLSWRGLNHSFQLYAAHTGDLAFKTQWNNDNYTGWRYPMVYGLTNGAGGAIYGTIFYDQNDTGYYLDPNSTGTSLRLAGYGYFGLGIDGDGVVINHDQIWTPNGQFHIQYSGSGNLQMCNGGGYAYVPNTSMRAPIFYDQNDTTYYVDPASLTYVKGGIVNNGGHGDSSIKNRLLAANNGANTGEVRLQMWCSEPGNTWDGAGFGYNVDNNSNTDAPAYYFGRPNASFGQAYMRMVTSGDWYFYNSTTGGTRYNTMTLSNGGIVYANNQIRSPIFYDSDDTTYWINPNGNAQSINVAGNIECTARSASWAEGIRVNCPAAGNWGGIRFTRSSGTSNWAIGYTGLNSTDDLTFYSGTATAIRLNLDHSGNLVAAGNITAYGSPSDRRLKENIQPLNNALAKVVQLQGCTFDWKEDSREYQLVGLRNDIGFIADEVKDIIPEMVREGDDGYLSLRDRGFFALLVEAIKEQQSEIDELKALVKQLLAK